MQETHEEKNSNSSQLPVLAYLQNSEPLQSVRGADAQLPLVLRRQTPQEYIHLSASRFGHGLILIHRKRWRTQTDRVVM